MTKLPEPAILLPEGKWKFEVVGPVNGTLKHCPVYTEAQMLQFRRDALEEAALLNWTEIMRDGALVTWHDAETLGDRVIEKIDAMKDET